MENKKLSLAFSNLNFCEYNQFEIKFILLYVIQMMQFLSN